MVGKWKPLFLILVARIISLENSKLYIPNIEMGFKFAI